MTDTKEKTSAAKAEKATPAKRAEFSYTGAGYLIAVQDGEEVSSSVVQGLTAVIVEAWKLLKQGYEVRATSDQNGNFAVVEEKAEEA